MLSFMRVYRRPTDRSKFFARITSARMSFRSYADGVMAYVETQKRASVTPSFFFPPSKRKNSQSQRTFAPSKQGTLEQGYCEANNFGINARSVLTEYPTSR